MSRTLLFRVILILSIIGLTSFVQGQQSENFSRFSLSPSELAKQPSETDSSLFNQFSASHQTIPFQKQSELIDRPSELSIQAQTEQLLERTYYPSHMKAESLGKRLVALLPQGFRNETSWKVNPGNSLTIRAPQQVIATADQLIPRMDANLQLEDNNIEVGVAQYQRTNRSSYQNQEEKKTSLPKMDRYYDPNENRYVQVAYQPENAIFPVQNSSFIQTDNEQDSLFRNNNSLTQTNLEDQSQVLDIIAYDCNRNNIQQVDSYLRQQFAPYPEIIFSTDQQSGRILIYTTNERHAAVRQFLASMQIYPITNAIEQRTPQTEKVYQVRGNQNQYSGQQTKESALETFVPSNKSISEIEAILVRLLEDRLQRQTPPNQNPDVIPFTERQKVNYRFEKRILSDNEIQRNCDIQFDSYHQKIFYKGDQEICHQITELLNMIDRQPLQNGKIRRFISIRYSDPNKLKEVFDIYSGKNQPFSSWGQYRPAIARSAKKLSFPLSEKAIVRGSDNFVSQQSEVFNQKSNENFPANDFQNFVNLQKSDKTASSESTLARNSKNDFDQPIHPVSYQDDLGGLGDLSEGLNAGFGDGMGDISNGFDPNLPGMRQGVGVVQDFVPVVLPDLDIIIIDNASEIEYERIRKMIADIEELAKRADYQIEIFPLKHVNSVMLQGMLETLISGNSPMITGKVGNVAAYGMQNPNAILLIGWGKALQAVKDIIEVFDQPILENAGMIRVIRLKYQSASEMATKLTTYFPIAQGISGGFAPRIRVFADVRTNSLIIQAAPNDMLEIQRILTQLDVNNTETSLQVKTFQLKHSLAEDIRTTIMNTILMASQGTLETAAAKFPSLEILSVDSQNRRLIKSGIMMDVNITADIQKNLLIVSAPEDCMELIGQLIEVLDVASPKAQIKIIQIKNGDASQIAETIQNTFSVSNSPTTMPTLPNASDETSFVPVRLAIDTRTNTLIVASSPKDFKMIFALILALDQPDSKERRDVVVPLRNVQAFAVAQAIDDYLTRKQQLEVASGALSAYQMIEANVIVIPEENTNTLLISATPENLEKILDMVEVFDKDPAKVVIQVLIAEVNLNSQEEFGIEAGLQDSVSFDRSMIKTTTDGSTGDPGYDIINSSGPGKNMASTTNPTDVAGQILNNFGMGTTSSDLNFGGFVLSASSRSVQVTLRALQEKQRLQILSRPQVTAMDNSQAFILVGQRVPRVGSANMTNYGMSSSVSDEPVGLILLVTPRITTDGRVIMEIGAEKSSIGSESEGIPVFSSGDQVIKSAPIDTVQAMTAISAHDGETVMIGGLIRTSKEKISRGVPYLSDVPVLGWLFRYDKEVEQRKELLIVMTPRIIRNSKDLEEIKRIEASKMNWNLGDTMGIQGNMGLFDPMTGRGMAPMETEEMPILHPDKIDDIKRSSGYNPQNDYLPKQIPEYDVDLNLSQKYGVQSNDKQNVSGSQEFDETNVPSLPSRNSNQSIDSMPLNYPKESTINDQSKGFLQNNSSNDFLIEEFIENEGNPNLEQIPEKVYHSDSIPNAPESLQKNSSPVLPHYKGTYNKQVLKNSWSQNDQSFPSASKNESNDTNYNDSRHFNDYSDRFGDLSNGEAKISSEEIKTIPVSATLPNSSETASANDILARNGLADSISNKNHNFRMANYEYPKDEIEYLQKSGLEKIQQTNWQNIQIDQSEPIQMSDNPYRQPNYR
ncbi:MAG: secretin N-terminal domain-containing protein [Planctomycetia bacterium]|nr:secretin N-terminal domain-containing protein [Planctomycetia bacterium]